VTPPDATPALAGAASGARSVAWWGVLAVVWAVSGAYVGHGLNRGWIPHDEGTLAQSAERTLGGELPHRDFDEVYTGGLSYANAAAFRVLGTNLVSLRLLLFAGFLAWVPALYYSATRFARPGVAGWVTALGVAWSLPTYSAAMPSWYNLFFATFGMAALLRHVETGQRRWVVAAGLVGGLSCLVKVIGLYYVAAALLFLVFREAALHPATPGRPAMRWQPYPLAVGAGLLGFVALLGWLVHRQLDAAALFHFVLPGAALAALAYRECTATDAPTGQRFSALLRLVAPFALGLVIPLAVFILPYLWTSSVAALWHGVFIAPMRRFDFAARGLPGVATALAAVPVAALLGIVPQWRVPAPRAVLGTLLVALLAFLVLSRHAVWYSVRPLLPLTVLAGVWQLSRPGPDRSPVAREQEFVVLSVAALVSLVQFPFGAPIYFAYVAPLAGLAALVVVAAEPQRLHRFPAAVLALYLVFAVVNTHPSHEPTAPLALARGGLVVPSRDVARYDSLIGLLRAHAAGAYTYAAPDCPEVYFLAGLRNPTRTIWDFFDDSAGRTARVLRALDDHGVTALAIDTRPAFSRPMSPEFLDSLARLYPSRQPLDGFLVRWRP
jgi:hypothetical protein